MNQFMESFLFEDEVPVEEIDLEKIPFDVYKLQETDVLNHKYDQLVGYRKVLLKHIINEKKANFADILQKWELVDCLKLWSY